MNLTVLPFGNKKFTFDANKDVEKRISEILTSISEEVLQQAKPTSLFIYGSFGRGEGTVYLSKNNDLQLLSDFELGYVSSNWFDRKLIANLSKELEKRLNCEITLSFFFPHRIKNGTISNFSFSRPKKPTIECYETTNSAFFLYGPDIRSKEAFYSPTDIPLWEGIRLIFNRMAEFSNSCIDKNNNIHQKAINKLLIACGDCLLLAHGKYHFLYSKRKQLTEQTEFLSFAKDIGLSDELVNLITSGYENKLSPSNKKPIINANLYQNLQLLVDTVFKFAIKKDMGFTFNSYDDFNKLYLKNSKLKTQYFRGFSGNPVFQNLILFVQKKISLSIFFATCKNPFSITHDIYSNIPSLFFRTLEFLQQNEKISFQKNSLDTLKKYSQIIE